MIKGVIFDADGTLIDSMYIWDELGVRYLNSIGKIAEQGLSEMLFPLSLEESSIYLKEKYNIPDSAEKIQKDILNLLHDFYRNEVLPKEGVIQFLESLKKRNIPMVIATSGDRGLLQLVLQRLEISHFFKDVLICSELNTNKRQPKIFLRAAEILGTKPEQTAVFEDAVHAIKAAKQVGFVTFAVEDDASMKDRAEIMKASDYYIRDFTDKYVTGMADGSPFKTM